MPKQERLLRKGPEVVVATPGRLWEGLRCHWPSVSDMRRLSWLVLDEADRMVQHGHYQVGHVGTCLARRVCLWGLGLREVGGSSGAARSPSRGSHGQAPGQACGAWVCGEVGYSSRPARLLSGGPRRCVCPGKAQLAVHCDSYRGPLHVDDAS